MPKFITLQFAVLALAASAWAATPVGTVSSHESFDLNGSAVPVAGVTAWPISAGDVIVARWAPATIVFRDGSRVVVARDSKVRIEARDNLPVLRLLQGSGTYTLAAKPALTLFVLDKPAAADPAGRGSLSLDSAKDRGNHEGDDREGHDKDHDKGHDKDPDNPPHPSPIK